MDLGVGQLDSGHRITARTSLKQTLPVAVAGGVVAAEVICEMNKSPPTTQSLQPATHPSCVRIIPSFRGPPSHRREEEY